MASTAPSPSPIPSTNNLSVPLPIPIPTQNPTPTFHPFSFLPPEIRSQIWQSALIPHIIRWIRTDDDDKNFSNIFRASTRTTPLLLVSHESREAVFFNAISLSKTIWFNPEIDYLHLDPSWTSLSTHGFGGKDPLDSLPAELDLQAVRRVMVHPNYTDDRLRPGIALERMVNLETILVVADEKSIGFGSQSTFLLGSVYDLVKYYEGVKRRAAVATQDSQSQFQNKKMVKMPHIAIGCLGWVGEDRGKLLHGDRDGRMLVAVFENHAQMKEHMGLVREEEERFLKERFDDKKSGLTLRFRPGKSMESELQHGVVDSGDEPPAFESSTGAAPEENELPAYAEVVAADEHRALEEGSCMRNPNL